MGGRVRAEIVEVGGCLANRWTIAIEQARTSNRPEIADGAETAGARPTSRRGGGVIGGDVRGGERGGIEASAVAVRW